MPKLIAAMVKAINTDGDYEIAPDSVVEFGLKTVGDNLDFPKNISLCNKTADVINSAEFSFEIQDKWDTGFVATISITNISDEALEAWQLSFNGNFEITNLWNASKLESEEGFLVENDVTTTPIAKGETKSFGFQGEIALGEAPAVSNFVLTSVVIDTEAEQPDISDILDEHLILCFGKYIEEENAVDIYCSSAAEGVISIYEKDNDGDWTKIADVENGTSYKYEITEKFSVKQIKSVQETDKGTIEFKPFTIEPAENGYTCTWLDSDKDGIPDYAEKIYGTDPQNPDTDSDGLTDYEEIYLIGTNPLKCDTDENGVNDADDDIDSDGLTNKREIELGTNPSNPDTDGDELSDGDEVNKYGTDPIKADTDNDTLTDGDEIAVGLDPNSPQTFGVPDAEYKFEQTISADSETLSEINSEEAPYELSLEISASGNAVKHLSAGSSVYSVVTESSARIGEIVDLSYVEGEVDKVKLIYEINDDLISNDGSEYAENCVDLQGIKRYNIFKYFEDLNMLLPVKTQFDEENNTLYAETDELGTYCLFDMEILLQQLNISPYGEAVEEAAQPMLLSAYAADDLAEDTSKEDGNDSENENYCVTFILDIRKDKIADVQLDKIKNDIHRFSDEAFAISPNTVIRLLTQDVTDFDDSGFKIVCESAATLDEIDTALDKIKVSSKSGEFGDYCIVSEALEYAVNRSVSSVNNYIFDFYNQEEAIFEDNISDELLEKIKNRNVNFSVISVDDDSITGYQAMLADITDGIIIDKADDITYENLYQHVYNKKVVQQSFSSILITGYQSVVLKGKLSKYNGIDTDIDTMTDWDEVGVEYWTEKGLITYDENNNMVLPTIKQCMHFAEYSYVKEGLERFHDEYGRNFARAIAETRILPIISDPTRKDSDGDGIDDVDDDEKLIPSPFSVKEIRFTPVSNGQYSSTICVTKLYNGNAVWEKWEDDNTDPDQIVSYLLTDELKDKLIKYANEKVAFGTDNYPIILGYTTEAVEARRLRDFKAAVYSTQSILDDTLNQYPYIKKYSDEYYGLWLYFVDLRITYDEAGQLIKEAVLQATYTLSMIIPVAKELVSNIRQYANIRHTVKLVGGKQNFLEIQKIISNYGNEAVEVLQKYDSITNIAQIENEIVENAVDKMGVSSKIEQSAELANLELAEQKYTEPPYKPGTKTQIVTFSDDIVLLRVLNKDSNPTGRWWLKASDIEGLSPLEIRNKYSLPNTPTDYIIVKIPAGNTFRVGIANSLYGNEGGGLQFEAYGIHFNPSWIIDYGKL